jgi:hypothetical protein
LRLAEHPCSRGCLMSCWACPPSSRGSSTARNTGCGTWTPPLSGNRPASPTSRCRTEDRRWSRTARCRAVFFAESQWVIDALRPIAERLTSAIDVGAGSARYRSRGQNRSIYDFLRSLNVHLTTLDGNSASGCDVCADITDASTMPSCVKTYDLVLCTSVLEHVTDVSAAAATLKRLPNRGGYLLVTVPRTYPRHGAPIDTGYRPSNHALEALFPDLAVLQSEIICPRRDKWFHWLIFPPAVSTPRVSCVLLQNAALSHV